MKLEEKIARNFIELVKSGKKKSAIKYFRTLPKSKQKYIQLNYEHEYLSAKFQF